MIFKPLQPPECPEDSTSLNRLHLPPGTIEQNNQNAMQAMPLFSPAPYPPQLMTPSTTTPPTLSLPDPVDMATEKSVMYLEQDSPHDMLGLDIYDNTMDRRCSEGLGDDAPSSAAHLVENAGRNYTFKWW